MKHMFFSTNDFRSFLKFFIYIHYIEIQRYFEEFYKKKLSITIKLIKSTYKTLVSKQLLLVKINETFHLENASNSTHR